MRGVEEPNLLNQLFFSKRNMDIVQYRLKQYVFWETWKQSTIHYVIKPQDETQLLTVMKYVYETYGKNLPNDMKEQIDDLDDLVVKEAGPSLVGNILSHVGYLELINNPIRTLDQPQNVSSKGTKLLPSITTTFGGQ